MAIFRSENLHNLLKDKYVLLLGDSVQRSAYKDLVVLSHEDRFISQSELRKKGEESFMGDKLVYRSEMTNGINYREMREFKKRGFHFKFHFITRIYNDYVSEILDEMESGLQPVPDVLLLNSCLWDISRYGRNSMEEFRNNLTKLCGRLDSIFPLESLVIWRTTLPVSEDMKGGFLTPDAEWCRNMLKLDILRANYYAYNIVRKFNYDVLDMHYHFSCQLHRQASDGVHWNMYAHRRMSNILLSHLSHVWCAPLPELPWADDSAITFPEEDVAMNATNVLKQAYEPDKIKLYYNLYAIPEEADEQCESPQPHPERVVKVKTVPSTHLKKQRSAMRLYEPGKALRIRKERARERRLLFNAL